MPVNCPGGTVYTIQAGDTFYSLANANDISVADLEAANPNVDPDNLQVGQVICIPPRTTPVPCPGGTLYTIRAGDTFYSISLKYGVTVSDLRRANPTVDPNNLQIGQVICIPPRTPTTPAIPRIVVLNPTDLLPNAKAWLVIEPELGNVIGYLTNVPAPTTLPQAEVYKLWVRVPGETDWTVTTMTELYPCYWVGRVATGLPLAGSDVIISAEMRTNTTAPSGVGAATGTI